MAYQNELYHHGTLGMKWGVRRYQNKDGSLTPAGKKRYAKLRSKLNELEPFAKDEKVGTNANVRSSDHGGSSEIKRESSKMSQDGENKKNEPLKNTKTLEQTRISKKAATKNISEYTDEELKKMNDRMALEKTYRENVAAIKKTSSGRLKFAKDLVSATRNETIKQLSANLGPVVANIGFNFVMKHFGDKIDVSDDVRTFRRRKDK